MLAFQPAMLFAGEENDSSLPDQSAIYDCDWSGNYQASPGVQGVLDWQDFNPIGP